MGLSRVQCQLCDPYPTSIPRECNIRRQTRGQNERLEGAAVGRSGGGRCNGHDGGSFLPRTYVDSTSGEGKPERQRMVSYLASLALRNLFVVGKSGRLIRAVDRRYFDGPQPEPRQGCAAECLIGLIFSGDVYLVGVRLVPFGPEHTFAPTPSLRLVDRGRALS